MPSQLEPQRISDRLFDHLTVIKIDYFQLMAKYHPPARIHLTISMMVMEEQRWMTME